jgi:hypothetical protein
MLQKHILLVPKCCDKNLNTSDLALKLSGVHSTPEYIRRTCKDFLLTPFTTEEGRGGGGGEE